MPMQRARYPVNWPAVAAALKEVADWTCQECGLACRRPGQPFVSWRLTLTVAHVYPETHAPDAELVCVMMLCPACHLAFDREHAARRTRLHYRRHHTTLPTAWARQHSNELSREDWQELADCWPRLEDAPGLDGGIDRFAEFGIYGEERI